MLILSLGKTFAIYESLHLEFRLDAFNSFNRTQWDGINTVFPSGSAQYPFGQCERGERGSYRTGRGEIVLLTCFDGTYAAACAGGVFLSVDCSRTKTGAVRFDKCRPMKIQSADCRRVDLFP